jgi:hypothetical protein
MRWLIPLLTILGVSAALSAQQPAFNRLPLEVLDVTPPSARVAGPPGSMTIRDTRCRSVPAAEVRQRIVNLSVQEWAFFSKEQVAVDRTCAPRHPVRPPGGAEGKPSSRAFPRAGLSEPAPSLGYA